MANRHRATIDFSGFGSAVWVDLNNPTVGAWTSGTSEATAYNANATIARLTSIENAIGTSGSDVLIGNAGDNVIQGGAGDDTIRKRLIRETKTHAAPAAAGLFGMP